MAESVVLTPEEEEAVRQAFREGDRERAWWNEHRSEMRAKYPEKVVAVKDGKVVAVVDDLYSLPAALEARGLHLADTWIEYMRTQPKRWML